jgi:predicted DNA-binding transcriptional regulator YafY
MVDRVERLTNLVALLLETTEPVSLVQIAAELAGQYSDGEAARRAAFERDKATLRELGVPIETEVVTGGPYAGQTRYWIDRRAYELADLDLLPDEVRAIQVALAMVRSDSSAGSTSRRGAIWKLGGELVDEATPMSATLPDLPELPVVRAAVASRSTIAFTYRTSGGAGEVRTVDPWGILLRDGFWYVLGYDHDRAARRTFRIDRFVGGDRAIEVVGEASHPRPAGFDVRSAFPADPKEIGADVDGPVEARVRVDASRASAVERELGADRVVRRLRDGSVEVSVPAANRPAFRSWVLGLMDHAVVLGPPAERAAIVAWLSSFVRPGSP